MFGMGSSFKKSTHKEEIDRATAIFKTSARALV